MSTAQQDLGLAACGRLWAAAWGDHYEKRYEYEKDIEQAWSEATAALETRNTSDLMFASEALWRALEHKPQTEFKPRPPADAPGKGTHVVYSIWGQAEILYVGVTSNLHSRLQEHWRNWVADLEDVDVSWVEFPTRKQANDYEGDAIRLSKPVRNIQGNLR